MLPRRRPRGRSAPPRRLRPRRPPPASARWTRRSLPGGGLPGCAQLRAGADDHARPARHGDLRDAGRRQRTDLSGADPRALREKVSPVRMSPPRGRTFAPCSTATGTSRSLSVSTTRSICTTASAPSGTAPPVEIAIASPGASARARRHTGRDPKTTGRRPGVSSARSAYPSIAELGNGGRSTRAVTSSARMRPAAAAVGTRSASSGCARASTRRSASSIDSSSVIGDIR